MATQEIAVRQFPIKESAVKEKIIDRKISSLLYTSEPLDAWVEAVKATRAGIRSREVDVVVKYSNQALKLSSE